MATTTRLRQTSHSDYFSQGNGTRPVRGRSRAPHRKGLLKKVSASENRAHSPIK